MYLPIIIAWKKENRADSQVDLLNMSSMATFKFSELCDLEIFNAMQPCSLNSLLLQQDTVGKAEHITANSDIN